MASEGEVGKKRNATASKNFQVPLRVSAAAHHREGEVRVAIQLSERVFLTGFKRVLRRRAVRRKREEFFWRFSIVFAASEPTCGDGRQGEQLDARDAAHDHLARNAESDRISAEGDSRRIEGVLGGEFEVDEVVLRQGMHAGIRASRRWNVGVFR